MRNSYIVTYDICDDKRLLEIQTRLLAKLLEGEVQEYPVFVTR